MSETEIPKTTMPTLEEFRAAAERRSFLLIPLESIEEKSESIKIGISDDPQVAFNKASRRILEFEIKKWRWPAGGAAIILELLNGKRSLLALHRDPRAPTYAGHNTLSSGLGCSIEEMLDPTLIVREGIEEFVIQTPQGIIYPKFNDNSFPALNFKSISKDGASLRPETEKLPLIGAASSVLKGLPGEKEVQVNWRKKTYISHGLILLDPNVNGIDVLSVIVIKVKANSWKDLKIYDGEVLGDGNLLNRTVHAYELDENLRPTGRISAGWKSGKLFTLPEETKFPQTPVLKFILDQLKMHV